MMRSLPVTWLVVGCQPWNVTSVRKFSASSSKLNLLKLNSSYSTSTSNKHDVKTLSLLGQSYPADSWTNVTPRVLDKLGKNLHAKQHHPLNLVRKRIQNFFYKSYVNRYGNPLYAIFDNISPIVTPHQNFDSLLIAPDHPSRKKTDTYYINENHLLRSQTSAHQEELIRMGFDAFLVVGDVYRRDEIDATHYPVFHQIEGVRLFGNKEVFSRVTDATGMTLFEDGKRNFDKQAEHTLDTTKLLEYDLKHTLTSLAVDLFGKDIEYRWVECYFPFTHPSWELEVKFQGDWLEVLGSGIMEQRILGNAGAPTKVGWAFGIGLERLAMRLYDIPDIRVFWSSDSGILNQFKVDDPATPITYKPVSEHPQCISDISFWIPPDYSSNDFFDLVRSIGGDLVEQVTLVDEFDHPKDARTSHCYRITYRHMERSLTQTEVNKVHKQIMDTSADSLGIQPR